MKNNLIAIALSASMNAIQRAQSLATVGHNFVASGNNFNPHQAKNKSYRLKTKSKYAPHQGKQECARRLKAYSPAWYSSKTYI